MIVCIIVVVMIKLIINAWTSIKIKFTSRQAIILLAVAATDRGRLGSSIST